MKLRVLVAEDDTNTRAAIVEVLEGEGYEAIEAPDGIQARDLFDRKCPQLVMLDVMMPGVSGYDVCRHIRSKDPKVPVLFITAKAEEIDKVVGLEIGADDYIVKPFGTKEMLARVRAISRRSIDGFESSRGQIHLPENDFQMLDLCVMPKQYRASRHGKIIKLSSREIKILQTLYANEGEVVERETLFRIAWQEELLPSTRTLDQTISNLRKRIERDVKKPKIVQTVYGVGYRFDQTERESS